MSEKELQAWLSTLRRQDDCLVASLMLPFAGETEVEISIETDEASISDQQVATVRGLMERFPALRSQLLGLVFNHYRDVGDRYRTAFREWGEDPDANAPLVRTPEELLPLLELQSVFIPAAREAGTFGIGFWSRWEQEHGVGVQFENWTPVKIGESAIHFIFE